RKTGAVTRGGAGSASSYGLTLMDQPAGGTPQVTVLYFGTLYANDDLLFTGATAANALPTVVMNVLHELGHASGFQSGVATAFDAWRRRNRQTSPTWYAASDPAD